MGLFNSMNFPMVSSSKLQTLRIPGLEHLLTALNFSLNKNGLIGLWMWLCEAQFYLFFYQKECYEFEENSRFIFLLSPYKFWRHNGGVLGSRAGIGIWCAWYDIIKKCFRKKQSSISQTSLKWLNFWHHFVFPHFSTRNIKKAKNWKKI